jgi:hypothetical protein
MGLDLIPNALRQKYTFAEWHHACAVLAIDFPDEFRDLMDCLDAFTLKKSAIMTPGGGRRRSRWKSTDS